MTEVKIPQKKMTREVQEKIENHLDILMKNALSLEEQLRKVREDIATFKNYIHINR